MWDSYFQKTKDKAPSKYLQQAIELIGKDSGKTALDFGCGAGRDSRLLSEIGFEVVAVDGDAAARPYIESIIHAVFVQSKFEKFHFEAYDLINASYSLPFIAESSFAGVWGKLVDSLDPGGIFVGEFFGVNDSWNRQDGTMTFHTKQQVEALLEGFTVQAIVEDEDEAKAASGEIKHWHVFHVVASKFDK